MTVGEHADVVADRWLRILIAVLQHNALYNASRSAAAANTRLDGVHA
jgi:hypothetical protein